MQFQTDLDVLCRLESIELIEELQHSPLDFRITASTAALASARSDRVDFVHENDTGSMLARHNEQLSDHAGPFADILLDELGSGDADKLAVRMVCHCTSEKRLACSGRTVE